MFKFLSLILILTSAFSISVLADTPPPQSYKKPLDEILREQLMNNPFYQATQKHTGIIFNYGKVKINLDQLTLSDVEKFKMILQTGTFQDRGPIHDLFGVEWEIKTGLDRPRYFANFSTEEFNILQTAERALLQRKSFAVIPELEEKRITMAAKETSEVLSRAMNTPLESKPRLFNSTLHLKPKNCAKLF